MIYEVPFVM